MDENKLKRKPKGLRKDKRVQVTLTIGRDENGKPIRKPFYGKTWTEARTHFHYYIFSEFQTLDP